MTGAIMVEIACQLNRPAQVDVFACLAGKTQARPWVMARSNRMHAYEALRVLVLVHVRGLPLLGAVVRLGATPS
jgi:hypothetical protein